MAQYVVTTVPHPEATLDEFARVLKPGGEIILVSRVGAEAGLRRVIEHGFAPAARKLGWRTEFAWERYVAWAAAHDGMRAGRAASDAAARAFLADPIRQSGRSRRHQHGTAAMQAAADLSQRHHVANAADGGIMSVTPIIECMQGRTDSDRGDYAWLSGSAAGAALGRPSLLSPQPDQPVAAPAQRAQLPDRLRAAVHRSGRGGAARLAGRR